MSAARRRRSTLFAPGHRLDLMGKMGRCAPDCVVLDLEDGTPPDQKQEAREAIAEALAQVDFGGAERVVRVNAMDSAEVEGDLRALRDGLIDPDAVMLPKVQGAGDLDRFEAEVGGRRWPLWILPTETALGYANLAASVAHPAVSAVIWAAEDLAADIGAQGSRESGGRFREVFRTVRAQTLMAAKAAGASAIDTTYVGLGDLEALRAEAEMCCGMGFDGKAAIHPSHVPIINDVFTPDAAVVDAAQRLVAAFEAANGGAIRFEGRMIDAPHYKNAVAILARAGTGGSDV